VTSTQAATLAALPERPEFRTALERACRDDLGWGPVQAIEVAVLKAHRERCAFALDLVTESGRHQAIAKAYARDRRDIFAAMTAYQHAGLTRNAAVSIPQPLVWMEEVRVRLEERVAGPSAQDLLVSAEPVGQMEAAARCGLWLARFQQVAPALPGRVLDLEVERPRWQGWAEEMAKHGEPFATKARTLAAMLSSRATAMGPRPAVAAHGSFIPDHIILSGARSAAIDLDQYGAADPAREVGWFLISVQRMAMKHLGELRARDDAAALFLSAYQENDGSPEGVARAGFYRAVECLHRGRRDLVARTPPQRQWAELMLDVGLEEVA
jgi:hypothetical protein